MTTTRGLPREVLARTATLAPSGQKLCRGLLCGGKAPVEKGRRNWCSGACIEDWRVRNNPGHARWRVEERDKGVCALCGRDCVALEKRIDQRLRRQLNETPANQLRQRRWRKLLFRLKLLPTTAPFGSVRSLWQADHIRPVVEGGGGCGLENLRTLCRCCHKRVTAELAARRARERREAVQPSLPGFP